MLKMKNNYSKIHKIIHHKVMPSITRAEIRYVIKKIKNNKDPGPVC